MVEKNDNLHIILNRFKREELKSIDKLDEIITFIDSIEKIFYTDYSNNRNNILKKEILNSIKILDEYLSNINILCKAEVSFIYFCKSFLLDRLPEYSKIAEDSATKSLKLNPFIADSYNCIAHIIWKKGDINLALNYFNQALQIDSKNKVTLRNLSMIVRARKSENLIEKTKWSEESVQNAKLAVDLDIKDADSWYIFGNSYFHHAFLHKTQYDDLQKAVNCYNMSEKYQSLYKNPDLYYNRAMVYLYLENYTLAYNSLLVADSIDPNLKAGEYAESVVNNIVNMHKLVKNSCGLKPKKLIQYSCTIPTNVNLTSGFELLDTKNSIGNNPKKLLSAKVVQIVTKNVDIPISLICFDDKGFFFVISVYNLSKEFAERIKPKTSNIVVIEPTIYLNSFVYNNKTLEYYNVKVTDPSKVLLDGSQCSCFTIISELSSTFFT